MKTFFKVVICLMTGSIFLSSVEGEESGTFSVSCEDTSVQLTAYLGGSITISCKYPAEEANSIKSLYRTDGSSNLQVLISAHESPHTQLGKFSLTNDKERSVYTVSISELTAKDAGEYVCAVERVHNDLRACLTEIQLHILSWDTFQPMNFSEVTSRTAQIKCYYPEDHRENEKFICKGNSPLNCKELKRTTEWGSDKGDDRISIWDSKKRSYFIVIIKNPVRDDSGTYWCGSGNMMRPNEYTKIQLSVAENHSITTESNNSGRPRATTKPPGHQKKREKGNKRKKMVISVVVPLLLFALFGIVTILCRWKLIWTQVCRAVVGSFGQRTNAEQETEENKEDHNYEEIHLEMPTVNAPPLPPYPTINFEKDKDTLTDSNIQTSPASVSGPQGAVDHPVPITTVYSTLKEITELL